MTDSQKAFKFLESLKIPEGRKAGNNLQLAPFQRKFIRGALKRNTDVAILSVGRGNGKSALSAGLALGALLGVWDGQPKREILIAARTRDQGRIAFDFVTGFAEGLDDETQERLTIRRNPRLEIEFDDDNGPHVLKVLASDSRNALGSAPTFILCDERGHWEQDKGDALEASLLSGMGKRSGRCLMISTSASNDSHAFSKWIDDPPDGTFVLEFRPDTHKPADDMESIRLANPGAHHGIGSSLKWLQAQAQRSIKRGGPALNNFRLFNLNQRVSGERRDMLLDVDTWLECETHELPPREGACVVGVDLGGSMSMSAAVAYWANTGRIESFGAFPKKPTLADRGANDGVKDRYVEMEQRGELVTMGEKVVPASDFLREIMRRFDGAVIGAFTADRYRMSEFQEAMQTAKLKTPVVWRGQGFKDGAEDVERFRQAAFDGEVKAEASLLLRSAFGDAVTVSDIAGNQKIAKARSLGRIDAAAAMTLAVAEGKRRAARPIAQRAAVWA